MRYAIDENKKRTEVQFSGQKAICPGCFSTLIGRNGKFRPPHWYHKSKKECDSWYEPMTDWHLTWQNKFPEKNREITIWDKDNQITHRADICLNNKLVIEIQHSPINPEEILQREIFYGKNGLIWILDGKSLARKCSLRYDSNYINHSISLTIPSYLEKSKKYDMDTMQMGILNLEEFKRIRSFDDVSYFEIKRGCEFYISFHNEKPFNKIIEKLNWEIGELAYHLFGKEEGLRVEEGTILEYYSNSFEWFSRIKFEKKNWRKFLDEMNFPIFFDNIQGLGDHLLYWYQKNEILQKENFMKKYLKYT